MDSITKAEPLHIQAYQVIKSLILRREYGPGERMVEARLAERLGISRGPVREAFRMLIQDGLLVQGEGSVYVYRPTVSDIIEVFQCRESLEGLSARLAAAFLTAEDRRELTNTIEKMRAAIESNRPDEASVWDQAFHDIITRASGNRQLIDLLTGIKEKAIYMRSVILENRCDLFVTAISDHERIAHSLEMKNSEEAEREMQAHIRRTIKRFLELVNENA
ncbi:GntR family transcriptional regulator [Aneurinibacillus soli]|uniref:Putative HTH-type transcriptional regulator YdfH n=1 Tax=Aneurinibacillus soli TaxID=1500254 RepID=A0A0U5B692_9BACL|nr:GntR family transcriptional regulator [Aneurinibacillus soli]PYE61216.1 GntR family transcriptional regulator [Aneurinibacillus soli]BAU26349.1 putative HTH-type transcriptional regulator YdfH [Aneurinibacillus soli]